MDWSESFMLATTAPGDYFHLSWGGDEVYSAMRTSPMDKIIPISISHSIKDFPPMSFKPIGEAYQLRWDIHGFLKSLGAQITGGGCGVSESDIEFEYNRFRYQLFVKCLGESE